MFKQFAAPLLMATVMVISGCGSDTSVVSTPPPISTPTAFQGTVIAGGNPVAGASVQLYAASASGYAASAIALGSPVTTTSAGAFSIAASYTCPSSSSPLYLAAQGSGSHSAMVFLTAIGSCGSVTSGDTYMVNEVTTAAFVWALAPFMSGPNLVGTSATNATGIANAFLTARVLADSTTGRSPAASIATTVTVESAKVYSLANALTPCAVSAACTSLFTAATVGSSVPSDTASAAFAVVKHPSANVPAVFQAGVGGGFSGLSSAPSDWTMSLASTGGGMNSPRHVSVDSTGRAWVVSYVGSANAFTPQGTPVFAAALTSSFLSDSDGITVDPSDNVWVASGYYDAVLKFSNSGSLLSPATGYTGGGIRFPEALASDASGNIWVVNNADGTATKLSNSGAPAQSSGYPVAGGFGIAVAVDDNATPWISTANGTAVHLNASGTLILSAQCCTTPTGIALDGTNNVWLVDEYGSEVVHLTASTGAIASTTTTGGLKNPSDVAVDSSNNVWATNNFTGTLTEVSSLGVALSPATGLGVDAGLDSPAGIAVDASGSLWVVSGGDNRLVRFVGLAAPVKTPLVSAPKLP